MSLHGVHCSTLYLIALSENDIDGQLHRLINELTMLCVKYSTIYWVIMGIVINGRLIRIMGTASTAEKK